MPAILLPDKFLRNHPTYDASSVATHLLSAWNALHPTDNTGISPTILIVLLQSGRFASAVYTFATTADGAPSLQMTAHKTSTRYTVRKGQGGSQSQHDSTKKAKSIGSTLRREGERQLRSDVTETWKEWKRCGYIDNCVNIWMGVPKVMRRDYLFGGDGEESASRLVDRNDDRIRSIPLDYGRPTLEAVEAVMECLMGCVVDEVSLEQRQVMMGENEEKKENDATALDTQQVVDSADRDANDDAMSNHLQEMKQQQQLASSPPYNPLHEAVMAGDLTTVTELIQQLQLDRQQSQDQETEQQSYDINTQGGPEYQTPLHLASSSTHDNASAILNALLLQARADPRTVDSRGRPPYYLSSNDKIRDTFRRARATLGESHCSWDDAKVGPPLTLQDIESKKAKAIEKKKRQRARQKEKRTQEAEASAKLKKEEEENAAKAKAVEDAKRIRDGLRPKSTVGNACDYCQTIVKKKSGMFQRLQYYYCSTDCVKNHQRELMAAAATARFEKK